MPTRARRKVRLLYLRLLRWPQPVSAAVCSYAYLLLRLSFAAPVFSCACPAGAGGARLVRACAPIQGASRQPMPDRRPMTLACDPAGGRCALRAR